MQSGPEDILEERYAIKSCSKLVKQAIEMYRMLQPAFGTSCMKQASVFEWQKRFKEGRDYERCGRCKEIRTPELISQINNFTDKDRRVYRDNKCTVWCQCRNCTHNYSRGTEDTEDLHEVCPNVAQRRSERKTFSWEQGGGRANQFRSRSSWCSGDPRWKLDLLLWPRDQEKELPVKACWLSQIQEDQTELIHPLTFDDPFFFWQH